MGGLKGVLSAIGILANTVFAKQMTNSLQKMQDNFSATKWPWQKQSIDEKENNSLIND